MKATKKLDWMRESAFFRKKMRKMHFREIHAHVQRHINMIEYDIFGKYWVVKCGQEAGCGHYGR